MDEQRLDAAVEIWQDLASQHAASEQGKVAAEMLKQWSSLARNASDVLIESAVARSYASAADFWIGGGFGVFSIDASYLPTEEAAEFWLRKIVKEFPETSSAEAALVTMARTWLGKEGNQRYGLGGSGAWGAASEMLESPRKPSRADFDAKMTRAIATIEELQKAFPKSAQLPRLQFMVAHLYWYVDDRPKAEPWLKRVREAAGETPTFWSHIASLRLDHWRK